LHLAVLVLQFIGFLGFGPGDTVYFLLLLALAVEVVLKVFVLVLSGSQLSIGILKILVDFIDSIFKLRDDLFVFLHFGLIVFVFVDLRVQLNLFPLQLLKVIVLIFDEIVEAVVFLSHQGNLVLHVLQIDVDVLVLAHLVLKLAHSDPVVVDFLILPPQDLVEPVDLSAQTIVLGIHVSALLLGPLEPFVVSPQLIQSKVQFLDGLDLVIEFILEHFLILLKHSQSRDSPFKLAVLPLPGLNLLQTGFEDTIDPVVLGFAHVQLVLVLGHIIFQVFVLPKLGLFGRITLLPLLDLVDLRPKQVVQPVKLLCGQVELVGQLVVIVDHLLSSGGLFLQF
jgi:hypothetical protein